MPSGNMIGGAYAPDGSYNRTGATDTGGTYVGATMVGSTSSGSTSTNATFVTPTITGNGANGFVAAKTELFTEDATTLTHTATVVIPAGSILMDIIVTPEVLWTDSSAAFTCGDANSANGWFTSCNLAATDLVLGEKLMASDSSYWGGVNGAYLVAATGRFGQQSTNMISGYCPTVYSVIGVVTVSTPSGTAGRTRMTVLYHAGQAVTPVLA